MTALRQGDVIGSILPGCGLFLHGSKWPDAEKMRECGAQVAVATDLNPGSSHIENLWVCAVAASTQCGLSLEESFWGITRGGALALGRPGLGLYRTRCPLRLTHNGQRPLGQRIVFAACSTSL